MIILGAGGFAREVALVLQERGQYITGYASDDISRLQQSLVFGKVLGSIESINADWLQKGYPSKPVFISGVGSPAIRKHLVQRALACGWSPAAAVISPKAFVPSSLHRADVKIGASSIICSGTSATVNISIGNYVNINLNCTLGHDCILEDYVNLSPGVNISGYAYLEEGVDVGTGAVILPHVCIGKGAVIGAGATVTKDVPAGQVWVGTPAKLIRTIG